MHDVHPVVVEKCMKSTNKEKEARLVYLERAPNYHYMAQCVDWLMHESWGVEGEMYSMIMKYIQSICVPGPNV